MSSGNGHFFNISSDVLLNIFLNTFVYSGKYSSIVATNLHFIAFCFLTSSALVFDRFLNSAHTPSGKYGSKNLASFISLAIVIQSFYHSLSDNYHQILLSSLHEMDLLLLLLSILFVLNI